MICPTCHGDGEPAAEANGLMICGACGETVIGDRKALFADVDRLSPDDIAHLRRAKAMVQAKTRR